MSRPQGIFKSLKLILDTCAKNDFFSNERVRFCLPKNYLDIPTKNIWWIYENINPYNFKKMSRPQAIMNYSS